MKNAVVTTVQKTKHFAKDPMVQSIAKQFAIAVAISVAANAAAELLTAALTDSEETSNNE